jgi:D-alanine-D-alanine ligase
MPLANVLIAYNEPVLPKDHPDYASEADVLEIRDSVLAILREADFICDTLGISDDPGILLDKVRLKRPDVIFNLFEGLANRNETEISFAGLLEWLQIPFTGSSSAAIALGRDKLRTKYLLQGAGLPTPKFMIADIHTRLDWRFGWPAIVKPVAQDASVGIRQSSVVTNPKELHEQIDSIRSEYGDPVLVEEFIEGREFHIQIVEDYSEGKPVAVMVPLIELRFEQTEQKRWEIYSYNAKWNSTSLEFLNSVFDVPVYLEPPFAKKVERIALDAFRCVGLRDYARLDIRLANDGTPYVLEVNPNPYLLSYVYQIGLEAMGRTLNEQTCDLVRNAAFRGGVMRPPPVRPKSTERVETRTHRQTA